MNTDPKSDRALLNKYTISPHVLFSDNSIDFFENATVVS